MSLGCANAAKCPALLGSGGLDADPVPVHMDGEQVVMPGSWVGSLWLEFSVPPDEWWMRNPLRQERAEGVGPVLHLIMSHPRVKLDGHSQAPAGVVSVAWEGLLWIGGALGVGLCANACQGVQVQWVHLACRPEGVFVVWERGSLGGLWALCALGARRHADLCGHRLAVC